MYLYDVATATWSGRGERVDPWEAARLVEEGLLGETPSPAWAVELDTAEFVAEFARGPTSRWVLFRRDRPTVARQLDIEETVTDLHDFGDEPPASEKKKKKKTFELRLVDEMGEAGDGIDVELTVDNAKRPLTTDADGVAKVDDAELSNANARIKDIAQLRDALRPRWETIRDGDWLDEKPHHSYIDCSDSLPVIAL